MGTWSSVGTALVVAVSTEPPGLDPTTNAAAVIKWSVSEDGLEYTLTV